MEQTNPRPLRIAQETLDAAYGLLSDGVIILDQNDIVLYANPAAASAVASGDRSPAGRALDDVIPASAVAIGDGEARAVLSGFTLSFRAYTEPVVWPDSFRRPVILDGDRPATALFFRAVQTKDAGELLENRRDNLLLAVTNDMPLGAYVLAAEGAFPIIRANRYVAQTFRLDQATIRGKTPTDFLPAPLAAEWRAHSEEAVRDPGSTVAFRLQTQDAGGFPQFLRFNETLYTAPSGQRMIMGTVDDVTTETYFHKYETANSEMLRRTQTETDLRSVLSIISEIVSREFDSCRMVWMDHDMNELMSFVRPDMADTLPRLTPELRERLIGYMRPILNEKHGCAIQEIGHVPELAPILEAIPGYPHAQLGFEIFNRKQFIGTLFIQFMDRMTFQAENLEARMMMVNTFSAILYRIREQRSLADSKRLLEQIIDALPMSFFAKDALDSYRYTMCNRRFCRMIGRTKEDVVGKTDYDFLPKPVADILTREQAAIIDSKTPVHSDVEEDVPGIGWHVFEKWLLPFESDLGGKLLIGLNHDVTEERKLHRIDSLKMNLIAFLNDNHDIGEFCDFMAGQMLETMHCDRIVLFPHEHRDAKLRKEWERPGVPPISAHGESCPLMARCLADAKTPVQAFEDAEEVYSGCPDAACKPKSLMAARIVLNGQFWGILAVQYTEHRNKAFSAADRQTMQAAGSLLTMAMERSAARSELLRREQENQMLVDNTIIPVAMFNARGRLLRCNKPYQESITKLEKDVKPLLLQPILNGERTASTQREIDGTYWQIDAHGVFDDASNKLRNIFMFAVDTTESVLRIRRQEATAACMAAILSEANDDIRAIREVVRIVSNYFSADGGSFIHFRPDGPEILATWGFEISDHSFLRNMPRQRGYTNTDKQWRSALDDQEARIENDLQNMPVADPGISKFIKAIKMGTRCSFRLMYGERVWGVVSLYFKDPWHAFSPDDRDMLSNFQHTANMLILKYELTQNLRAERDKAISAEKAKSFFFSCISHDIRTPLNSIIGFSELLQQGGISKEKAAEYLGNIIFSGNTLMQLINDVLDFASLDAGKLKLYPAMCDFKRLAQSVLTIVGDAALNKSLYLKLDVQEDIPWLLLDSQRISQILFNLIGNAVKFTSEGGVTLHIRFTPDAAPGPNGAKTGLLVFTVQDTGIGIERKHFDDLLQPFVRIHTKTQTGGTGLGLSICNLLAEKMGGRIVIDSRIGEGSSFTVELPGVEYQTEAPAELKQTDEKQKLPADLNLSLLLVDDAELNLKVLAALCRKLGLKNVKTAGSGADALELMKQDSFDAVLTDVWMPNMSGEELAAEIRRNPAWAELPVFALTADVEMRKRQDPAPFTGILLKPLRMENIAELLIDIQARKK